MTSSRLVTLILLAYTVGAQAALDGHTAGRWRAQPGWVQALPEAYEVSGKGEWLVFEAKGAGTEMPWTIELTPDEGPDDARYLVLRYRATGLVHDGGNYFLHGWEGTIGGITYALNSEVEPDGEWRLLAVDFARLRPRSDTTQLGVKVVVDQGGEARLEIERIEFTDELPAGARVSASARPERRERVFTWDDLSAITATPGWTARPAAEHSMTREGSAMTFAMAGSNTQMRWTVAVPEVVNLEQLPYLSLRYRASGHLGLTTYALWLGDDATGAGGRSAAPLMARDLLADGRWHHVSIEVREPFMASQMAVGLDCEGAQAEMTLDAITFSSEPASWPMGDLLPHEVTPGPWPPGDGGWVPLPLEVQGGRPSPFLGARLGLADWFAGPNVRVGGVPFTVYATAEDTPQTGASALGTLRLPLPQDAREVYLLAATTAPPTEPWGIDWEHPRQVEILNQPEKVVLEIEYADGPSDEMLPLDAETASWGMGRGLSVCVAHPDPTRRPVALALHDRMQTASFAILGATVRADEPRLKPPTWEALAHPMAPDPPQDLSLQVSFETHEGLTWAGLSVPGTPGALGCEPGPVFEVEIDREVLPAREWSVSGETFEGDMRTWTLDHAPTGLSAEVGCQQVDEQRVALSLRLTNGGTRPLTATVRFPVLQGITMGHADDTWYLFGRRGGIINREPVSYRLPLGEPHPLQMDGFFNPATGLALACLTTDTQAQHHFLRLSKDASGGAWAPEYVERDLSPGETFAATEAELVLRAGDWRAIFEAYREWLATWYRRPERKTWWERTFAFITRNAHYDAFGDPAERGAVQPAIGDCLRHIGVCDTVHLFGWSSSPTYGDWGDYGHYDETVGGLENFRANIADAQARGVAVGLYLDGYLSSAAGEQVGRFAEEWAMRRGDGSPAYIDVYRAYNQCPYMPGWRDHLASTYERIHRETGAMGLYIDEFGATDGRWFCHAKDHGHNGYEIPYAGEVAVLGAIREAVGPEVALYTEYPPAEVSRQILDGSFTYQALWSADEETLAPHFIDLPRFAFPLFKQFHIIYYVAPRAGNWWLLKFPFFNGESYDLGQPNLPGYDDAAMAFQRRAIEVLCEHREAFSSEDVEPLVRTEMAGVFANRFAAEGETVWTLYNANGRTARGVLLRVPHTEDATYQNAWTGEPLGPQVAGGVALIDLSLGPKGVGCIAQSRENR